MNTRGGCEAYRHQFIDYVMPAIEYDAGWYRWFADQASVAHYNMHIKQVFLPFEELDCSV